MGHLRHIAAQKNSEPSRRQTTLKSVTDLPLAPVLTLQLLRPKKVTENSMAAFLSFLTCVVVDRPDLDCG